MAVMPNVDFPRLASTAVTQVTSVIVAPVDQWFGPPTLVRSKGRE